MGRKQKREEYRMLHFSSVMLFLAGAFDVIWGITALTKEGYLNDRFLFGNLTFWGWFWMIVGVITMIAAFSVLKKAQWARWFGIVVAGLSILGMFTALFAFTLWAAIIISFYVIVIYSLVEYGGQEAAA
jgi:hypothetical protein